MQIEVNIKPAEVKPVRIEVIGKRQAFQLTRSPDQPIYLMDSWDDKYYYAINTGQLSVETLRSDIMVYPVAVKCLKLELELE